jgi:predicted site-specific integrase-resolvase
MATTEKSMTTQEFADASGVPAATISKLIRQGKLKARKKSGKWMIPQGQLEAPAVLRYKSPPEAVLRKPVEKAAAAPPAPARMPGSAAPETVPAETGYSIAEFSAMTYLTEKGVAEWLKTGRIVGRQRENGEWRVSEENLSVPDIRRLLRK